MTSQERTLICKSLIKTLKKIIDGTELQWAERVDACQKAIDIFCDSGSNHSNNAKG